MRRSSGSTPLPRGSAAPARDTLMKKTTRVNHPPKVDLPPDNHAVVAPIYQTVKFEFDTLEETERYFRGERPRVLLHACLESHDPSIGTAAGRAPGTRRVPGNVLRCRRHLADVVGADETGRSHPVFRRNLRPYAAPHSPPVRPVRCDAYDAVDRRHRGCRARSCRAPDAARHFREPDESGHQDRRHRSVDAPREGGQRSYRDGQHVRGISPAW